MDTPLANPVLAEVTRGNAVESRHRGAVAVCDATGRIRHALGDIEAPVYPRSAAKLFQALPLIESGAADAFHCSAAEIALACASHSGEPGHVDLVRAWLARLGLEAEHLACGGHLPAHEDSARALLQSGAGPTRLHDNCSGKHAAMLCVARHLGAPLDGYEQDGHPVQHGWIAALEQLAATDLATAPRGADGCGIPVLGLPLRALATACAWMAAPDDLDAARAAACRRITSAVAEHPWLVAGTGRFDTAVIEASGGDVLVKSGAEGVHVAFLCTLGLGVAVKVDDGAGRAASTIAGAVLQSLGALDEEVAIDLAAHLRPPIHTRTGAVVGMVRPAPALAGLL